MMNQGGMNMNVQNLGMQPQTSVGMPFNNQMQQNNQQNNLQNNLPTSMGEFLNSSSSNSVMTSSFNNTISQQSDQSGMQNVNNLKQLFGNNAMQNDPKRFQRQQLPQPQQQQVCCLYMFSCNLF